MPVLGAASGLVDRPGIHIPLGSLDRWRAGRDASASQLVEVNIHGDSTTQGNHVGTDHAWVATLRELSRAHYADGGKGMSGTADTALSSNESLAVVQSQTGWIDQGGGYDPQGGNSWRSQVAGDSIVFQGYGTQCRLYYALSAAKGDFTCAVDGGSPVTINAFSASNSVETKAVLLALGANGLHTVTVVNLGGLLVAPPTMSSLTTAGSGGTLPANTYRYVVTSVTANGETIASSVATVTTTGTTSTTQLNIIRAPGAVSYNVYRATGSSGGTFDQIAAAISSGGNNYSLQILLIDDGSVTPNAAVHPPVSGTAGRAGPSQAAVIPAFMKATGICYHNHGISGSGAANHFGLSVSDPHNQGWFAALALGLNPGDPPVFADGVNQWSNLQTTAPQYPHPALAIWCLGGNNQAGATSLADARAIADIIADALSEFIRICRATQVDPLVVVEHFEYFGNRQWSHLAREAVWSTAVSMGAAVVDIHQALGPYNTGRLVHGNGPHLPQTAYDIWAGWLWTNVLSL